MTGERVQQYLPEWLRYWGRILSAAGRKWVKSHAFIYAAALAFFTLFSMAPVVIIAVTIVGWFLGPGTARDHIAAQLEQAMGPDATAAIFAAVEKAELDQTGLLPTMIGVAVMVLGATTVFAQMQAAFNQIWDVAPRPSRNSLWIFVKSRLLSLTIVLIVGFVLLVSLLLSVALRSVMAFAEQWLPVPAAMAIGLEVALSLIVVTTLFGAMFRVLPDVLLSWRDVLAGAFITALLFTLGRSLIAMYLAYTATASTYGAAGSLVLVLLWVNYSSLILLYGAACTRAHLEARGKPRIPRKTAVCVHTELLDDAL
ncbi:MAG: YihY/virulence factor BrkB family protein [Gammaproteobacteria bacterium]